MAKSSLQKTILLTFVIVLGLNYDDALLVSDQKDACEKLQNSMKSCGEENSKILAENKWKDQADIDSKISSKWKSYVRLYEKGKSEYKPCTDFNAPDSQQ